MTSTLACISPIDGSVYAERPALTREEAFRTAERARAAQPAWAATPIAERTRLVMDAIARLEAMADPIVTELAWQMGRPVRYGGEMAGVRERASHMAAIAHEALSPIVIEESAAFSRRIERVPHGVVLVVAPWNYPFMTAINTVVPALIAGNAVLLKHATQTLLAGERLAEAFHGAGVPRDVFVNVALDHDTTAALIAGGAFGFVNFTGSVSGGRAMERAAAGTFTAVSTELGGKDPAYVLEDADVASAAATLIDGAMFNSGQCCCGIERIYVHDRVYDAFLEASVDIVEDYVLGDPREKATTLGPMAHRRFAETVRAQRDEAFARGARGLIDAAHFPGDDGGAYLAPQILVDVDHGMEVMREETFGPVVGIMRVGSDEEALALMNDSRYGLTAALWTPDIDRAAALAPRIETGTVYLNRCDYLDPALCWTGCKQTGRGAGLSVLGYHAVTRPRSYHFRKA